MASLSAHGRELVDRWTGMDRSLGEWVVELAEFDSTMVWRDDGASTCANWLVHECGMGWSTAKEKLRVGHELLRRPVVRAAFEDNSITYTQARILVRLEGLDDERDAAFVDEGARLTARTLEQWVQHWNWRHGQDRRPTNLDDHYGMFRSRGFGGGMGRLVIEAPDDILDRLTAIADATLEHRFNNPAPAQPVDMAAPQPPSDDSDDDVDVDRFAWAGEPLESDPSAAPTDPFAPNEPVDMAAQQPRSLAARRLDALLDIFEVGAATSEEVDPEVAAIGVTVSYESLLSETGSGVTQYGTVLSGEAVRRLCCDAGIHRIVTRGVSEILDVGRKTRTWSTPQRRAIRARHGHVCAANARGRRITQVHHIRWWEDDGVTSIDNGVPLCSYHHHLVHEGGWSVSWDKGTGVTELCGPLGQRVVAKGTFSFAA